MWMLELWLNAYNQHLRRAEELYSVLTPEMKIVADNIKENETGRDSATIKTACFMRATI